MNKIRRFLDDYFHKKSLRYQLLVTYLIINMVPLVIFGLLSYHTSSSAIIKDAENNNTLLLEAISGNMNSFLRDNKNQVSIFSSPILHNYTSDNKVVSGKEEFERLMKKETDLYSSFETNDQDDFLSIRVFNDEGKLINNAFHKQNLHHFTYNSPEEAVWQQRMAKNASDELIFDVHPLEINGMYSFTVSKAILDPVTGKRFGYISFDKRLSAFSGSFKQFEYRSGGVMQVIKPDGTYLYHSNNALISQMVSPELLDRLKQSSAGTYLEKFQGKTILITYNKLMEGNMTVIGSVPLDVLTEDIFKLRNISVYMMFLSITLVAVLSYFLAGYIVKPIKKLSSLASSVERGKFDIGMPGITNANKEINRLSLNFHSMVDTINHLIKIQYETELHKKDAELKALIMQINPHFLYNTLEVISGIADAEGVDQITMITESMSKMLRYNIDLNKEQVTIADELEHCRNFVLILKSRFEDQLAFEWDIDDDIERYWMIKMVLQPLVENSIKHGIEKKLGKGYIKVSVKRQEKDIEIQIKDNGAGFDLKKLESFEAFKRHSSNSFYDVTVSKNLGLKNVYTRLHIFFGDKLSFIIHSIQEEGTVIAIRFPAISDPEDKGV